jgi:hypothetical protein
MFFANYLNEVLLHFMIGDGFACSCDSTGTGTGTGTGSSSLPFSRSTCMILYT